MKGLKINDSDFVKEPKTKKHNKKSKNPDEKKNKKKGQDFLDYANKNNIEINIEYEENKYQQKKIDNQNLEMEINIMIIKDHIIKEDIKMIKIILKKDNHKNLQGINLTLLVKGLHIKIIINVNLQN